MRVIEYLNGLAEAGHLATLLQAGLVSPKVSAQREYYNTYQGLCNLPTYADNSRLAVQAVAQLGRVHEVTIYKAIKAMRQKIKILPLTKIGK